MGAELGMILLPLVQQLIGWLRQGIAWFQGLQPETQKLDPIVAGAAAVIGPVLLVLGSLATALSAIIAIAPLVGAAFTLMLGPVGLIIIAVAALVAIFATDFLGIRTYVLDVAATILDALGGVVDWFTGDGLSGILDGIGELAGKILEFGEDLIVFYFTLPITIGELLVELLGKIGGFVTEMVTEVSRIGGEIVAGLGDLSGALYQAGIDLIQGFIDGIWSKAGDLVGAVEGVFGSAADKIGGVFDFGSPSKLLRKWGGWAVEGFELGATDRAHGLNRSLAGIGEGAAAALRPPALPAAAATGTAGGGNTLTIANGAIVVEGAGKDAGEIADLVVERLMRAWHRVEAGAQPAALMNAARIYAGYDGIPFKVLTTDGRLPEPVRDPEASGPGRRACC